MKPSKTGWGQKRYVEKIIGLARSKPTFTASEANALCATPRQSLRALLLFMRKRGYLIRVRMAGRGRQIKGKPITDSVWKLRAT